MGTYSKKTTRQEQAKPRVFTVPKSRIEPGVLHVQSSSVEGNTPLPWNSAEGRRQNALLLFVIISMIAEELFLLPDRCVSCSEGGSRGRGDPGAVGH